MLRGEVSGAIETSVALMTFPLIPKLGEDYGTPVARGPWQLVDADPTLASRFGDPGTPFTDPAAWVSTNGQLIDVRGITSLEITACSPAGSVYSLWLIAFQKAGTVYLPSGFDTTLVLEFSSSNTNPAVGPRIAALNPGISDTDRWASAIDISASPAPEQIQAYQPSKNTPMYIRLFVDQWDFISFAERSSDSGVAPIFIRPVQGIWDTPGSEWWR